MIKTRSRRTIQRRLKRWVCNTFQSGELAPGVLICKSFTPRTDDLYDLYDLYDLFSLHDLHLSGQMNYRSVQYSSRCRMGAVQSERPRARPLGCICTTYTDPAKHLTTAG